MTRCAKFVAVVCACAPVALAGDPGPIFDPFGDAIDAFGGGPPLLDIDMLDVRYDATMVHVTMTFYTPISAPSEGMPDSVAGWIEFDTDQNTGTGVPPLQNSFAPPFTALEFGSDFICDVFTEAANPGSIAIIRTSDFSLAAEVPITFTDMSLAFSLPSSALNDDGLLDFTAIIGTAVQPTDGMEVVGESIPAPSSLALLAACGLAGVRRRRC